MPRSPRPQVKNPWFLLTLTFATTTITLVFSLKEQIPVKGYSTVSGINSSLSMWLLFFWPQLWFGCSRSTSCSRHLLDAACVRHVSKWRHQGKCKPFWHKQPGLFSSIEKDIRRAAWSGKSTGPEVRRVWSLVQGPSLTNGMNLSKALNLKSVSLSVKWDKNTFLSSRAFMRIKWNNAWENALKTATCCTDKYDYY